MKQILQSLKDGSTQLADVPAPSAGKGQLLIHTTASLVSAGTERMLVEFGKAGWVAEPLSVTLHLIDDGIDTGEIIEKIAILPHRGDSIKILRERCVIAGVKAIVKHAHLALHKVPVTQENCADARQRQCFVMSPALRELLCARLPELIEQQLNCQ